MTGESGGQVFDLSNLNVVKSEVDPANLGLLGDTKGEQSAEDLTKDVSAGVAENSSDKLEEEASLENKKKWTRMILVQAGVAEKDADKAVNHIVKLFTS